MAGLAALVFLARVNAAERESASRCSCRRSLQCWLAEHHCSAAAAASSARRLGAMILMLIVNALNLLNVAAAWHPFVSGAIVMMAILADALTRRDKMTCLADLDRSVAVTPPSGGAQR